MARHGENIHKRKDGRWEGRYIKGRSETGKAIWGYVYAYSYVDAKSALIRKKVKAADYTVPLGAQELTFSVLSELWLSTLNDLEESSIAHYRYSIEHYILPVIGNLRISQLSGAKLELCVLQIISPVGGEHKPFGASLSRECISLVRRLCKYAYKLHLMPMIELSIKPVKETNEFPEALSLEEQAAVNRFVFKNPTPRKAGILFMLQLGLRISEVWIAPYFSQRGTKLNEINVLDIEMFYAHEKNTRNISGNTVAHYHANIHKALVDAVRLKLIPHNPASDVERPKKDNFVASYYTADELMEMFPIFAGTKMELPVLLAAYYGLRRSEVVGLKWSAIDFVNKTITISHTFERVNVDGKAVDISKERTKNNSSFRTLPLIPEVETALIAAKARQEKQRKQCGRSYCKKYLEYICVDDMGNLVNPNYISGNFSNILRKNGLRPIRFHDLRHSCASLLIKNKIPMKDVQVWMGHSSFATTANIYAHIDTDSKQEAADMISACISLSGSPDKKMGKKNSPKRIA